jgi:dynein light intermediate chain 1, cytosolic
MSGSHRHGHSHSHSTMNQDSRSSSPEAPPQDLWSTILNSVSSSRSIPAKNILVLGQPSTGKSTLVSALLQKPAADASKDEPSTDFALGYDWADVRDEGEEGLSLLLAFRITQSYNASPHTQISSPGYPCTLSHHLPLHIQPSCHTFYTLNPLFSTPLS